MRHLGDQPLPHGAAPMQAGHIRLGPGFIDKDQPLGINVPLVSFPLLPAAGDVMTILLTGAQSFF